MAKPFSLGEIHLDVDTGRGAGPSAPDPETPFHVLILGDFSGRGSRNIVESGTSLASRRHAAVDRDDLDDVMARFRVELEVPVAGRIRFAELDDFHPDRLYERLALFEKLREAREEVTRLTGSPAPKPAPRRASAPIAPPDLGLGGLLDQAVEQTESRAEQRPAQTRDPFQSWLKEVVEPHVAEAEDPRRAELAALVTKAASAQMRSLLHFPSFQALEAAWRAVFFLVRRVETDSLLKLFLLDVSKDELAADLDGAEDLRDTGAYALLTDYARGIPWAVIGCNYRFGPGAADVELLARLGAIGKAIGAPVLGEADQGLAESTPETGPAWEALRHHGVARHIGLALPRFLLRLPYGRETDPCERFAFEEMGGQPEHDRYLWGNPVFACVALLAQAFASHGWDFRPGMYLNLDRLPLHIYQRGGETVIQPCAEALMTERMAERLLDRGLMPLASLKETDEARLVRFQSVAAPAAALAGRWA